MGFSWVGTYPSLPAGLFHGPFRWASACMISGRMHRLTGDGTSLGGHVPLIRWAVSVRRS